MAARFIALGLVAAAALAVACGNGDSDGGDTAPAPASAPAPERDAAAALRRELAPSLAAAEVTIEPSCPPPAVLACRPALRLVGTLRGQISSRMLRRDLAAAVPAALRLLGFRRAEVSQRYRGGELAGRAVSGSEELARWRTRGNRFLELVTGGLRL